MKQVFFLVSLCSFFSCIKEKPQPSGQLVVKQKYCKYGENSLLSTSFELYKDQDLIQKDSLIFGSDLVIDIIPLGKYSIEFESIYQQKEAIEFQIKNPVKREVTLCVDYLDYNPNENSIIENLKVGEIMEIDFFTFGCFHSAREKIILTKKENSTSLDYKTSHIVLTGNQLQLLKEFEIELRQKRRDGCTTNDHYQISNISSGESFVAEDESCQWNGFSNLVSSLGIKS